MMDIRTAWEELKHKVSACRKCGLCESRHNTVFGEGPVNDCHAVIVGEAPGEDEDISGRPFVGRAGQLLTDILEKGGKISRDTIYITNTIKCRPPGNRNPSADEISACSEYLEAQLLLLHPDIVVTMGNIPTKALLDTKEGITSLRGKWHEWRGIRLLPMFHPSYLLRTEGLRGDKSPKYLTWQDVLALKTEIDKLTH